MVSGVTHNVIVVTGSVCSGKTTLSRLLSDSLEYTYVDVNKIISDHGLSSGYDPVRKCEIIDTENLSRALMLVIEQFGPAGVVIDSHMSHYLPSTVVNVCVVTRCELDVLKKRLISRGYDKLKVEENLEAEICETCLIEAQEAGHHVVVVDTTKDIKIDDVLDKLSK